MWRRRIERVMVGCPRGFRHPEAGSVAHYAQLGAECRPEAVRGVGHKFTARTVLVSPVLETINFN